MPILPEDQKPSLPPPLPLWLIALLVILTGAALVTGVMGGCLRMFG